MTGRVPAHDIKRIYLHEPPRQKKTFHGRLGKEGKHGRREDLVIIPTLRCPKQKNPVSQSNKDKADVRRRSDADYGRFVHGIRKAFAT